LRCSFGIGKGSGVDLSSLCLGSKGAQQNPELATEMKLDGIGKETAKGNANFLTSDLVLRIQSL